MHRATEDRALALKAFERSSVANKGLRLLILYAQRTVQYDGEQPELQFERGAWRLGSGSKVYLRKGSSSFAAL